MVTELLTALDAKNAHAISQAGQGGAAGEAIR